MHRLVQRCRVVVHLGGDRLVPGLVKGECLEVRIVTGKDCLESTDKACEQTR